MWETDSNHLQMSQLNHYCCDVDLSPRRVRLPVKTRSIVTRLVVFSVCWSWMKVVCQNRRVVAHVA